MLSGASPGLQMANGREDGRTDLLNGVTPDGF